MRRIFGREEGALNGYIIGVVCLALVIVGGVFLLKYLNNQKINSETKYIETVNTEKPGSNEGDDTTTSEPEPRPIVQPEPTPEPSPAPITLPQDTPESISNAGPTEVASSILGLLSIAVAGYMAWNYHLACVAVKKSMLKTTK